MNEMLHFGYHLRSVRQQRKYSQRTLATAAGIAVSFLAKIEMGKASPTLMTLMKLAEALDLTVVELLSPATITDTPLLVIPQEQMHVVDDGDRHWQYLFPQHENIRAVMINEIYQPHTKKTEIEQHKHDVCGVVLEGTLIIEIPMSQPVYVNKGDSFYIKAGTPHRSLNQTDSPTHIISVELLDTTANDADADMANS
jgi:transcriptional regulator with XRE-family HTH domain